MSEQRLSDQGDVRPRPDPTVLTTAALVREITALRELFDARLGGQIQEIRARLDGMDKAIVVFTENLNRIPTNVDRQVGTLQGIHEEKFRTLDALIEERDKRFDQSARDSKLAVEAAFTTANNAVSKSEASTTKQIESMAQIIRSNADHLSEQIADMKDRLTKMETATAAVSSTLASARAEGHTSNSWALSLVMAAVGIISLAVTIIVVLSRGAT